MLIHNQIAKCRAGKILKREETKKKQCTFFSRAGNTAQRMKQLFIALFSTVDGHLFLQIQVVVRGGEALWQGLPHGAQVRRRARDHA